MKGGGRIFHKQKLASAHRHQPLTESRCETWALHMESPRTAKVLPNACISLGGPKKIREIFQVCDPLASLIVVKKRKQLFINA